MLSVEQLRHRVAYAWALMFRNWYNAIPHSGTFIFLTNALSKRILYTGSPWLHLHYNTQHIAICTTPLRAVGLALRGPGVWMGRGSRLNPWTPTHCRYWWAWQECGVTNMLADITVLVIKFACVLCMCNVQVRLISLSHAHATSENTATVVYPHCTNRFEHHAVAVFSLGSATTRLNF